MLRDPPSRLSLPDVRFIFFSVLALVLVAAPACGEDCDGNGVSDPVQIAASPELDCNGNGILDLCETGGYVSPPVEQNICELAQWMWPGAIYTGSTIGSTNPGYTAGECPGYLGLLDVWYLYVPDSDGSAHITVEALGPTGSDIHVCVYNACPNNGGSCTVCTSAYKRIRWVGPVAFLSFDVLAGNEYYVQVGSPVGKVGNFTIEMVGPNCVTSPDCDGDFVPDECQEATSCGPGVLCYDDGDGAADVILNEPNPASFLVKFSVPETFGGPRKITRVTWYAGSGTIESPKVVVRGDLAGGFGTSQACIVEDATAVVPNTFDQVDVGQNPHQFVVHGGDIFYAGVYGAKMSVGADSSVTTERMTSITTTLTYSWSPHPIPGTGACDFVPISVPTPTAGPGSKMGCWAGRGYKLDASGTSSPGEMVTISSLGSPSCHYNHRWLSERITVHTPLTGKGYSYFMHNYCQVICHQDFRLRGQDWLIRVSLSGSCSPELISGCTDDGSLICDTFQTFTPTDTATVTPTPTITLTPSITSTPTITSTPSVTATETPTFAPIPEYDDPVPVTELNSDGGDAFPHLTGDLLEMFFVSDRTGDIDIWSAVRESIDSTWNTPFVVTELNSTSIDTCPAVSADGLEIFFSSHRDVPAGQSYNRVYRSTRPDRSSPWSTPVEVLELRPPQVDNHYCSPSYLSEDGLRIYTHRRFGIDFDLYVSARSGLGTPFSGPTPLPGNANTGSSEAHIGLSGDELTMIFGRVTGAWNLFGAKRSTPTGAFQVLREMTELNDPTCGTQTGCVSSDMTWIWFSSDRPGCPGPHDIYVAKLLQTSTPTVTPTATATPTRSTGVNGPVWRFR